MSPFIGKWKTLLIFVLGGVLAEVPYSMIVNYGAENYGGGSSGGIFALIAVFLVCYLRFPEAFQLTWRRVDLWIAFLFFIFANDNQASFLTHVFGFVAGILLATIMVVCKVIDRNETRR